uniref:Thioredoxin domain-containing protein n=1 Tax=Heligmosomoides polygyrus TaxID=6339 RepID=A0A8L8K7U4_HELPZ
LFQFYAPWCAHCKRLLPIWEHLGHAVSDKNLPVRVAKMDCTRFTGACNKLSISGYPTILFFRQGRRIEYNGERTKEALFNFIVKSAAPIVEKVNAARINDVDSRNDPAFVIIGDEKDDMHTEFEAIADSLFSKVELHFCVLPNTLASSTLQLSEGLRKWIMAERWPVMPRASGSNLADIASSGKLTVLVICTEVGLNILALIKARGAAEDLRESEYLWSRFQFAWMDGPDVATSIVMGNMELHLGMLVLNYSTYEYYLNDDEPEKVTRKSIVSWLNNLADGIEKGTASAHGGRSLPVRIRRIFYEVYSNVTQMFATQPLLSSVLFGMPIAFLSIIFESLAVQCSLSFETVRRDGTHQGRLVCA